MSAYSVAPDSPGRAGCLASVAAHTSSHTTAAPGPRPSRSRPASYQLPHRSGCSPCQACHSVRSLGRKPCRTHSTRPAAPPAAARVGASSFFSSALLPPCGSHTRERYTFTRETCERQCLFHWLQGLRMSPKSMLMHLTRSPPGFSATQGGVTTFHARNNPKCSGLPCGGQDNSQTLVLSLLFTWRL